MQARAHVGLPGGYVAEALEADDGTWLVRASLNDLPILGTPCPNAFSAGREFQRIIDTYRVGQARRLLEAL